MVLQSRPGISPGLSSVGANPDPSPPGGGDAREANFSVEVQPAELAAGVEMGLVSVGEKVGAAVGELVGGALAELVAVVVAAPGKRGARAALASGSPLRHSKSLRDKGSSVGSPSANRDGAKIWPSAPRLPSTPMAPQKPRAASAVDVGISAPTSGARASAGKVWPVSPNTACP